MRIYRNFQEAFEEIRRDLKEMGTEVTTASVQDKQLADSVAGKQSVFKTLELVNYAYTVLDANPAEVRCTQPWASAEWNERKLGINGHVLNPGYAYHERTEQDGDVITWQDFLEVGEKPLKFGEVADEIAALRNEPAHFSYTYGERFARNHQVRKVIRRLREDPNSRQLYVSMWDPNVDPSRFGQRRVPCSLGWQVLYREGALHITYFMRSCELGTHFYNDVWMSLQLQRYIAEQAGDLKPGRFTHFIGSFHCYEKNVSNVF